MVRQRLMTPGPTPVPESALLAMAQPLEHHRTPDFRQFLSEVLEGLRYVFDTTADVAVLNASGTGAMEACVTNVVPRGGIAIVLESGKFAQRWTTLCRRFGIMDAWRIDLLAVGAQKALMSPPGWMRRPFLGVWKNVSE